MDTNKEAFDLVCSLGGNCMAASQLQQRGLRNFSLPFDWLYMIDYEPIPNLINSFKNNFSNFILKEDFRHVPLEEMPYTAHKDRVLYQNMKTKYFFLNHFDKKLDVDSEFEKVKEKIERRIKRFLYCVNNSDKILFLLSHSFFIENQPYIDFYNFLKEFYPNKEIYIKVVQFNSNEPSFEFDNGKLKIIRIERKNNYYDFVKTNIEWQFLDNIECDLSKFENKNKPILEVKKIKKGISLSIFPFLNTLIYSKLYLFGLRIFLSFGKNRVE